MAYPTPVAPTPPGPPPLTSYDLLSGKLVPATSLEWDTLLGSIGVATGGPTSIYGFQDASGNILDTNGKHHLGPLAGTSYRIPVSGWSRLAAGIVTNGSDTGFVKQHSSTGSPALPDPATYNYMMLAYVVIPTDPTADWTFMTCTDSAVGAGIKQTSAKPYIGNGAAVTNAGGTAVPIGTVFPVLLKKTNNVGTNTACKVYTPWDVIDIGSFTSGANTGEIDWGMAIANGRTVATANYLYGAMWASTAALMTDTQIGAMLTALGWTVAWYSGSSADVTSGKQCPIEAPQWEALNIPPAVSVWPFQESAAGNYIATDYVNDVLIIGAGGGAASIVYGSTVSGWTRTGLKFTGNVAQEYLNSTSARLPDPAALSIAQLAYVNMTQGYGTAPLWSEVMAVGGLFASTVVLDTSGHLSIYDVSAGGSAGTYDYRDGAVHPLLFVRDITNARTVCYTDKEKITQTYATNPFGPGVSFGAYGTNAPAATYLYGALWAGPVAELTDAQARAMLQKLGWTVAW